MLYACCLQGFRPSLESCKLSRQRVPLALMCALLFKGVAVPLRACMMLLYSCCAPAAAPNPIRCLPEMFRPPRPADEGASKNVFKVALFKMILILSSDP